MRRPGRYALIAVMAVAGCVAAAAPSTAVVTRGDTLGRAADQKFVPGEAIVRFKRGTTPGERGRARSKADVDFERSTGISRAQVVEVDGSVRAAVARLERQPDVLYAQPNYLYKALAPAPDDTRFGELWGLENTGQTIEGSAGTAGVDVSALDAWDDNRGSGTVIAIADSGVDKFHPDIQPNLVPGFDFVSNDGDPDDFEFHGTHVAGTAAAVDDNTSGIAGVAPDAQIMPVRVLDGDGSGSSEAIGDGIEFAAQAGADVINLSLGGAGAVDRFMSDAVDIANAQDAVVVVAAGNGGDDGVGDDNDSTPTVPCNLPQPNLICVAAIDNDGNLASFSNFGPTKVDVGAPGVSTLSAKTDYDNLLPNPGFEATPALMAWNTSGNATWGASTTVFASGARSATDSPGDYANLTDATLASDAVNFTGRQGCRLDFTGRWETELGFDYFDAFARRGTTEIPPFDERGLTGDSGGFVPVEQSLAAFDGLSGVSANFQLLSDDQVTDDGAYVDDVMLGCRPQSAATEGNAYHYFDGTSMAAPHVAAVAALVGTAAPALGDTQIVQAIRESVDALPALSATTADGGLVNADAAIARALSATPLTDADADGVADNIDNCPGDPNANQADSDSDGLGNVCDPNDRDSDGVLDADDNCPNAFNPEQADNDSDGLGNACDSTPNGPPTPTPATPAPRPTAPAKANLRGAKRSIRVRRGRFSYSFRAGARLKGSASFTSLKRVRVSARRKVTLARKSFTVPSSGKVTLRIKLSRKNLRILKRNKRIKLRVTVKLRNTAGLTSTATKTLTLRI